MKFFQTSGQHLCHGMLKTGKHGGIEVAEAMSNEDIRTITLFWQYFQQILKKVVIGRGDYRGPPDRRSRRPIIIWLDRFGKSTNRCQKGAQKLWPNMEHKRRVVEPIEYRSL